jgi:hypothetical protein
MDSASENEDLGGTFLSDTASTHQYLIAEEGEGKTRGVR